MSLYYHHSYEDSCTNLGSVHYDQVVFLKKHVSLTIEPANERDERINVVISKKFSHMSAGSKIIYHAASICEKISSWSSVSTATIWKNLLKFIYSEKATKFCEIFTLLLSYVVPVKSKVKISQNWQSKNLTWSLKKLSHKLSIEERELAEPLNYLPVFEASRFLIIEICQTDTYSAEPLTHNYLPVFDANHINVQIIPTCYSFCKM